MHQIYPQRLLPHFERNWQRSIDGVDVLDKAVIEKLRHELGFKDPGIFEKAVYALNLLPSLLDGYPDLIFKGGTSILLPQISWPVVLDVVVASLSSPYTL